MRCRECARYKTTDAVFSNRVGLIHSVKDHSRFNICVKMDAPEPPMFWAIPIRAFGS
jgi:hypothetical protein